MRVSCRPVILLGLVVAALLPAEELLVLGPESGSARLGGSWYSLLDKTGRLTVDEVMGLPFIPEPSDDPSMGFSRAALWLRFSAVSVTPGLEWVLECANPPMDEIDVVSVRQGTVVEHHRTGDLLPVSSRPMNARTFRFPLRLRSDEPTTYYLRLRTQGTARAPFRIWESRALAAHDVADQLLLGAYFGVLLIMVLYNLLIFLSSRDRSYLYYIGYVASHALFQAAFLGVATLYLWPNNPWIANRALVGSIGLAVLFSCLFAREFLQRGRLIPGLKVLLEAGIALAAVNTCGAFLLPYSITVVVGNVSLLLFSVVCFLAGVFTLARGYTPARFYLMAWSVLLFAVIWLSLGSFSLLPGYSAAATALQVGSVMEVVLLSLAITDRINLLRRQAAAAEKDLALSRERELKATTERLYHDALTGLPNRARLIADEPMLGAPSLFLVNVDGFKQLNDFYGNRIGDQILLELGRRIDSCPSPLPRRLYRLHADEYALVLEGEASDAECLAHGRVVHAACTAEPYVVGEQRVRLDASIGVARPGGPLLEHADMALSEARADRASVRVYDPSMDTMKKYASNLRWIGILRDALKADAIFPYFQPIRDNATGRVGKYESLVRLRLEDGSVVGPGAFLRIAKTARLYPELSRRVIDKSLEAFREREHEVSVNVSIEDVEQPETLPLIRESLARYGMRGRVTFELLESEGIRSYDVVARFIEVLKAEGCRIAIDDFGAGYSNFEHILRLNVDYLKLDSSLVKNLDSNRHASVVIETIQSFASRLGLRTIAEHVHSEQIQRIVESLGVHYSQGFHVGEPAPV